MAGKREKSEEIVSKLSRVEVRQGQGIAAQNSIRQKVVPLQPDSDLGMTGEARHEWIDAIPAGKTDLVEGRRSQRSRRNSLTFRQMSFEN